jgi:NADH:ubiquinone oxidoreductase subunit H
MRSAAQIVAYEIAMGFALGGVVMQRGNREASNAGASSNALKVAPAHRKRNSPFEQGPVTIAALQCNK